MMGQIEVSEGGAPLFPHENMCRTYFYPYVTHAETGKEPGAQSGGSRCPAQAGAIVHLGGPSKATWARGAWGLRNLCRAGLGGGCLKIQHRIATEKFLYHQQSAIGATSFSDQSR